MWNNLLLGGQKMTIRKAEEKDILRIIELLGQVLDVYKRQVYGTAMLWRK